MAAAFELIDEPSPGNVVDHPSAVTRAEPEPKGQKIAMDALILALSALSRRALVALSSLFTLATVASAWWLWMTFRDPSINQLISLGGYAVFVATINWMVYRGR